ncbi:radical SAM protein [Desulfoscipio gibsoniae]
MYKPSSYNFVWPLEESNNLLLFNGLTTRLAEIPGDFARLLEAEQVDPEALSAQERKLAEELIGDGFLVEEPVNELKLIKYAANSQKYNRDVLSLTIAPTMDCNFKCPYCYQGGSPATDMTEEVRDALVEYAARSTSRVNRLLITWFGGEPLLAREIIYRLSEELIAAAGKNGCSYAAFMVTNGALLDAGTINKLKDYGVGTFQVTLDGPPEMHNSKRNLPGGGDSFGLILANIKELLNNGLKVHIRVNIDGENLAGIEELLDILAGKGIKNANIYPAQIAPYTEACKSIEQSCLNKKEFVEISKRFFEMLLMKGLATDYGKLLPRRRTNYCGADQINSFSVDPEGYLYKCWSDFGAKEHNVGNIVDLSRGGKLKNGHIDWLTWDPLDFSQCRKCKYLPLCMGGCPHKGMKMNGGKPECSEIRFHLESIVKHHYRCVKIKEYCRRISGQI